MSTIEEWIPVYNEPNGLSIELETPCICPHCYKGIEAIKKGNLYVEETDEMYVLFFCNLCKKVFIAKYIEVSKYSCNPLKYEIIQQKETKKKFEKSIEEKFPNFCNIYNQSLEAENYNLDQVAGVGYRKALEFLIKDYCIFRNPDLEEKIKEDFLGPVIDSYVEAPKIKATAKVATWLGNDETHYVRKYEDKDIDDLKKFIQATVSFIEYDLVYDNSVEIIEKKSKTAKKDTGK